PRRRRIPLLVAGILTAGGLAIWVWTSVTGGGGEFALTSTEALAMIGGPLLLVVLLLGATILATQRIQAPLVAGGLALTALAALSALDPNQFTVLMYGAAEVPETVLGVLGHWLGGVLVMRPYSEYAEVLSPVLAFLQIAGAVLVTLGILRGSQLAERAVAE